jgi:hypothetical protein
MMQRLIREPLFWILLAAAALRLPGLFWGLPAADGWDDDGFAPRNFLTALALTWKPGAYFTYPPLHAIVLAIPSLPVAAWALAHAPSLHPHDVISEITKPIYMTYFAILARLISVTMSLGIIWCVGQMAQLVAGARAGLCAAAACALGFGLTYYGQVSNLDVPYLFWACLSLLWCMRAVVEQAPRRFWGAALFAAAAVATKDQAYALFVLSLPLFLAAWFAMDAWPRQNMRAVLVPLLSAGFVALLALLLVDGAITNPSGFLKRVAFLTGPASQDYAEYVHGPAGWWALLKVVFAYFGHGYGVVVLTLAALGVAVHLPQARGRARVGGLLPPLAMLSFTACFNFAALRTDDRFLLPQGVLACIYIGIAAAFVLQARPVLRLGGVIVLAGTALFALHQAMAVNAAMLLDPRYDAERWLAAHAISGDSIEVYDRNWLLPRFPAGVVVNRVGPTDVKSRNPLPGVTETQQPFGAPRKPRFILASGLWMRRYRGVLRDPAPGRAWPPNRLADMRDADARAHSAGLDNGSLGYQLVHVARFSSRWWPAVHIHDSLDEPIGIYERMR